MNFEKMLSTNAFQLQKEFNMDEKDKVEIPKNSKKAEANQAVGYTYIVSEGSPVVLDARDLIAEIDRNSCFVARIRY
jgi:hypothetical protein